MAIYITFASWTDQGIKGLKQSPARIESFKKFCEAQGAEVKGFYSTMGEYDFIVILDAPTVDVVGRVALAVGSLGNVRTKTIPAFETDEFVDMVAKLG
ncbi:MAG: GYD domain-containing protein [Planctomycetota bacterium]|jgi:uncharacterized protein with GYD domain